MYNNMFMDHTQIKILFIYKLSTKAINKLLSLIIGLKV